MTRTHTNLHRALKVRVSVVLAGLCIMLVAGSSYGRDAGTPNSKPSKHTKHLKMARPLPVDDCTAACPTDFPPTSIAFSGPFSLWPITLPGTDCAVKICYCTRETSPGNNDFVITEIIPMGGDCSGLSIVDLVQLAYKYMRDNNPMGFPCPPCGGEIENYYNEVKGSCWHYVSAPPDWTGGIWAHPHLRVCDSHFWCMTPYRVCCDENGDKHFIKGATVIFGDQNLICDPDCTPVPCDDI